MLTHLEKCQFFNVLHLLFLQSRKAFSRFRIAWKTLNVFPGLYCLKKKKLEKGPFLNQNHGLIPLEKCQFFSLFKPPVFFFWPRKAFFRFRISQKIFCWPLLSEKKAWKMAIFEPKTTVIRPLEKSQFLDFLNFFFLEPRKAFFRSRIS